MNLIEIKNLSKEYIVSGKKLKILNNINIQFENNKITVILGKSGCGKTTLLRLIQGLETPTKGNIFLNNNKTSYVFQEPRLFEWLTIFQNIAIVNNSKNVDELINIMNLTEFKNAYPNQLSGGMKSRVSIARAFNYNASYLLMDEPFSNLDDFTRLQMQKELLKIYNKNSCGIIFVTHNIDEALLLAHKIIILKEGKIYSSYDINEKKRDLLNIEFINLKRKIREDIWR